MASAGARKALKLSSRLAQRVQMAQGTPWCACVRSRTQPPGTKPCRIRRAGPARVAEDVGGKAQSLDLSPEAAVTKGVVGREHSGMRGLGNVQAGQGSPRSWQVVAVSVFYFDREDEPGAVKDGLPVPRWWREWKRG